MKKTQKYTLLGLTPLIMAGCGGVYNDNVVQEISGNNILLKDIKTGTERIFVAGAYDKKLRYTEYSLLSVGDTVALYTTTQKWYDSGLIFYGKETPYDDSYASLGFYKDYKAIQKLNDFYALKQQIVSDTNQKHR